MTARRLTSLLAAALFFGFANAYEINNHADMSETSAALSALNDARTDGKLFRLGLKPLLLTNTKQTFPLDTSLLPIPYCFGSDRPAKWKVTIPVGDSNFPTGQRDGTQTQPDWSSPKLTLAQMIRYGACFEDADDPNKRPLTHFYNPQDFGLGQTVLGNPIAANSLVWTLTRNNPYPTALTGTNHYTWEDARESFYDALTLSLPNASREYNAWNRNYYWGKTFQALGHMVHHLQDGALVL